MAYIRPACDSIEFNSNGSYFMPTCDSINFSFGITGELGLVPFSSEILIQSEALRFFSGKMFLPKKSSIIIESDKTKLDILIPISIDSSEILVKFDSTLLQILPDMVIQNSFIQIESENVMMRKTESYHLPSKESPSGKSFGWSKEFKTDCVKKIPWGVGEDIRVTVKNPGNVQRMTDKDIISPWVSLTGYDVSTKCVIDDFEILDHSTKSSWIGMMDYLDHFLTSKIAGNQVSIDWHFKVQYNEPGAHDVLKKGLWDTAQEYDWHISIPWGEPGGKDANKIAAWGPFSYYTLCSSLSYNPPDPCKIIFAFPNKYPLVSGICEGIRFNVNEYATDIRCPYESWHSGERDKGSGIIVTPRLEYPLRKKVYYMFNTVFVEEVITKTPIEVLHVDAKIDRNSWLWSFNITVAAKCYLDLIKPINGVMGHVKINMNGYIWFCTVEGWSENRSFGTQAWTIVGRSPSMMFGDPIGEKNSGVISIAKQGQTIIEELVQAKQLPANWPTDFQGWTADFSDYNVSGRVVTGFKPYLNWYLPADTVNYTDKTDIEIIKDLATSIGAYVQTEPDQNKLTIKPMFAHQPWDWNVGNSNIDWIAMDESQIVEIGRSNELKPYYQAISVVGESIGGSNVGDGADGTNTAVYVEVRRTEWGPGTASYAPMITNPYVTSSKVGLEMGRMQLAQTGEWVKHTLRIGALCPEGGTSFGLFKTGDMISVIERGTPWFGQVTGVSIVAANAGAGFAVEQVIEVEQYRGE